MSDAYRLRPWTEVVRPHQDVASGDLAMGTYAANLAAAALGSQGPDVYVDATEFFKATYVTTAMRGVVGDVFGALTGQGTDRVVQLRTPFGGGKTHSLLALYHLASHRDAASVAPELDGIPDPGPVRVAILSGEYLDPQRGREVEGRTIRTLWGELAYQLGGWGAYDGLLVDGDEGTPPGGERLGALLGDQPTLVLLDEVLIYIAKAKGLPKGDTTAGTESLIFLQNLTEAVNQRPHAAMVYSLQASVGEAVGEEALLGQLEKIHGRIDVRREPVSGDEVLRVVQRRLFDDLGGEDVRREVARAYADQLRTHLEAVAETDGDRADAVTAAATLEERITASYPFHPELIDLMHHRWGSLPMYQRTRGALQFLATAVHALWAQRGERDAQALIGPGDVDLSDEGTRASFLEQVGETDQYTSVLQADFLAAAAGTKAIDLRIGRAAPALDRLRVGTRVATAIMLLSFGAKQGEERGALEREVVEASLVPGLDANVVREALREMRQEALLYLHHANGRYRFDTVPNVNKLVRGESEAIPSDEVLGQVRQALESVLGPAARMEAVVWPSDSAQVNDDAAGFRIVYLPPDASAAPGELDGFVLNHGVGSQRVHRNALAFAIPTDGGFDNARRAARTMTACERLLSRATRLNLTREQKDELRDRQEAARRELAAAVGSAYERVRLPIGVEDGGVRFDDVDLSTTLGGRPLHDRIRDALYGHVFETLEPSRVARIAKLEERQFGWCEQVVDAAYRYFDYAKLWSPSAIRAGIAKGVSDGVFAYATGAALTDDDNLTLPSTDTLRLRTPMSADQVDLGPGSAVISLALAQQLRVPEEAGGDTDGGGDLDGGEDSAGERGGPDDGGGTTGPDTAQGSRVRLEIRATEDDLHTLQRSLSALRDLVRPGTMQISVTVRADSGGTPINRVDYANRVAEPLDEDPDVEFKEYWDDETDGNVNPND